MYQLRQLRMSHGQLASRRVYFLLGFITRLPTHATLNTVNSPPFRTEVSSFSVFFLVSTSQRRNLCWTAVINTINPWIVPDHSPSTITRTDGNSWSPLTTHIFANYFFCPSPLIAFTPSPPLILHLCIQRCKTFDMCTFLRTYLSQTSIASIPDNAPVYLKQLHISVALTCEKIVLSVFLPRYRTLNK